MQSGSTTPQVPAGAARYQRELQTGIQAVRLAAQLCRSVQAGIAAPAAAKSVMVKEDRSPVTVADFGSQALICAALHQAFPDDPIMAEEDAASLTLPQNAAILSAVTRQLQQARPDASSDAIRSWIDRGRTREFRERFWSLDPIDGTKGFLRREQYAISLALIVDGRVELAILGCPNLPQRSESPDLPEATAAPGLIFHAIRTQGAWSVPISSTDPAPAPASLPASLHVSLESAPARARFVESVEAAHSSHSDAAQLAERMQIVRPPLRMDSQAKYATVARGDAEFYLRMPTRADYREKIWDHAGGMLLVAEAGGTVTDISGKTLEFHHGPELLENRGVVASNGVLHDFILAALRR